MLSRRELLQGLLASPVPERPPLSVDTMLGEWLLHPDTAQRKLGLKNLCFFRLGIEMTEISELLGLSESRISQIHTRALVRLNRTLSAAAEQRS